MENHPIPQDVTGFQFKLIGNMTVKQFAYLATGVVLAWVFVQLPINGFVKFPIAFIFAIIGIGLAFFPVSGRPMDLMLGNFIKALFRPTQFVYEKSGNPLYSPAKTTFNVAQYKSAFTLPQRDKLKLYLQSHDAKPKNKMDEKENSFLMSVSAISAASIPTPARTAVPNLNIPQSPRPIAAAPFTAQPISKQEVKIVKPILTMPNKEIGLPSIPDSPNVITGITKDARGNPLSNILVEVKDKDGNPVRAFKTNEVGRFASATALVNGIYAIEFEDPKGQNKFEAKTINVAGQIIMPIQAISIDTREELRRSLFSGKN
ncbi:MAG: PrgI family protein [bacterium]|nr:PrgI family protein [bacterium]